MKGKFEFLYNRKISIFLFVLFLGFNLYYFIINFFSTFLNKGSNGDEYYEGNLYDVSNISVEKIFYSPSQPYIFICSFFNFILNNPKMTTRLVTLVGCLVLIFYFIKKIILVKTSSVEKTYKITFFICAIFITNQIFMGTSDFLSFLFIVFPFLIIIESVENGKINLSVKQSIIVGVLFSLSIATRPTALVLMFSFYLALFFIIGLKNTFCKENLIIGITALLVFLLVNIIPIVEQNKVILDIKEVPKETGVNWFQRNYLMAKFWDSNKIPNTQWISTQEVIDFKKANPGFYFPRNVFDLLIKEPGLYLRQMTRMFVKGFYSSYRYMYLLFPLLFMSFLLHKKNKHTIFRNAASETNIIQNQIVVVFHLLSIVIFSFLALKLFEFRWVIPTMILYCYFALNYLSKFPEKIRFLIYNGSFISGIVLYILFFIQK